MYEASDQVEAAGELLEGGRVARGVVVVRAEREPILLFGQRLGQDRDVDAERVGDLHTDVAQPTPTRSPTWCLVTAAPTSRTKPTIS